MQLFLRTEKLCLEAFSSKVRNLLFQAHFSYNQILVKQSSPYWSNLDFMAVRTVQKT